MIAMKITLTRNRQYGGSGEMPCLGLSAIKCLLLQLSSGWTSRNSYACIEWLFKIYPNANRREVAVGYSVHRLVACVAWQCERAKKAAKPR